MPLETVPKPPGGLNVEARKGFGPPVICGRKPDSPIPVVWLPMFCDVQADEDVLLFGRPAIEESVFACECGNGGKDSNKDVPKFEDGLNGFMAGNPVG